MIPSVGLKDASLLVSAVAAVVYLNTLDCGLLYDDEPAIKWNTDIRPHTSWMQIFSNDFWGTPLSSPTSHKSYRPVCVASFRLNYMLHGLHPMGYHLLNVLLHALVCYLYVQLCALVFTQIWPALLAGLLFAVHPIHTEAVAGVVGRAELLSAMFFLLTFLVYCKSLPLQTGSVKTSLLIMATLALSVLSMLSKEQGITVLAVCLFYDYFIFTQKCPLSEYKHSGWMLWPKSETSRKGFFKRAVTMSTAALAIVMVRLAISHGGPSKKLFTDIVNPPLGQSSPYRQLSWFHLVYVNLQLLLVPSQLSVDWRYGAVSLVETLADIKNLYTLASIGAVVTLGVVGLYRNSKPVLLGIALMVFPFLPASNLLFPVGFVVAERVLYLPSMGYCMLVALGVCSLLKRLSHHWTLTAVFKTLLGFLLLLHAVKTVARNRDWYSATSLNRAGVCFNPNNPILLSNLGIEHAIEQDFSRAEQLYLSSMQQTPTYSGGYYNYGILMELLHRYEEAEEPLLRAIEVGARDAPHSKLPERYDHLISVISRNTSRLKEALEMSNQVQSQHPTYAPIYITHCNLLMKLNRTNQFIKACELAVLRNQQVPDAHYNLGLAYLRQGQLQLAETFFKNTLALDSSNIAARFHLAGVLQTTGTTQHLLEARTLWKQVLAVEQGNVEALLNLAIVDALLQHYSQALEALEAILTSHPNHKEALYRTGQLLYKRAQYPAAVSALSRLSQLEPEYRDTMSLLDKAQNRTNPRHRHGNIMDIITPNNTYT